MERPGGDLLAGAGDADDDALAPTLVAALEGLAHHFDIADAFERIIDAAVGHVDDRRHDVFLVPGIDEVRHAELLRQGAFARIDVDTDDAVRADDTRALYHVEADAAEPENGDVRSRFHLGGIHHRPEAGGHAAADVADLVEGRIFPNLRDGDLRQHREIRERRGAHVVKDGLAVERKARSAVRHQAPALGFPDSAAEVRLAGQAELALPALGRIERDHVIARRDRRHPRADFHHDACAFVTHHGGEQSLGIGPGERVRIRVTDPGRLDLHHHFARRRPIQRHRFHG